MAVALALVFVVLCINVGSGYHRYHKQQIHEDSNDEYADYYSSDDTEDKDQYKDNTRPLNDEEPTNPNVNLAPDVAPRYEVTEKVDDIPNIMEFKPIVSNYSIAKPINLATGNSTNINNSSNVNNTANSPSNSPINIVSVVNKNGQQNTHQDIFNFNDVLKVTWDDLQKGLVSGFKKLGKELADVPVFLIDNVQSKAKGVVNKVHSYFSHDHEDEDFDDY